MKIMRWVVLAAVVVLPVQGWAVDACDQDRSKVCGGVTPGDGAVHACMLERMSQLTPTCRETVQQSHMLVHQFVTQCKDQARRYCAIQIDLRPEDALACARAHKEQFSPECKKIYKQFKAYDYPILK